MWYRFADRAVRGEKHYFRCLNYIHRNPVKHGFAKSSVDWRWSSVHRYVEEVGVDTLKQWWETYPLDGFGDKWDA